MHRLPRVLAVALAVLVTVTTVLVASPSARADANAPRWSSGDFWLYADPSNPNNTLRVEVVGRENAQTIRGTTYEAFHMRETSSTGSISVTTDTWVRESDLGIVKTSVTIFNVLTVFTFDPPQTQASFPLSPLKAWTVALTVSTRIGNFWSNTSTSVSFQVDAELDVRVPAGTFHSFSVRTVSGGAYTKAYYSDQAGYWSKKETYNAGGQKTGEMDLTGYRYQWNTTFLAIIGTIIAVAAIAVIAFLYKKRKKAVGLPGGPAAPPP